MNYTIYNSETGIIEYNVMLPNGETPSVPNWIEGQYSGGNFYITNGHPVAKPVYPQDGLCYDFDPTTKNWQVNTEANKFRFRAERDQLLASVDRVNPVRYASLSEQQQQDLIAYRQALLDVPQQTEFPDNIVWPEQPTWL